MSDVEAAREAFGVCRHKKCLMCEGKGTIEGRIDSAPCEWCGGDGKENACRCFAGLSVDAVLEALTDEREFRRGTV